MYRFFKEGDIIEFWEGDIVTATVGKYISKEDIYICWVEGDKFPVRLRSDEMTLKE